MSSTNVITLVEHIVTELLVTDDPDYAHVDTEIRMVFHGKNFPQIMRILKDNVNIKDITFVPDPGKPNVTQKICDDTVDRLMPYIPFVHLAQMLFGPPGIVGTLDMRMKNRSQYNGYIEFQYDAANPTVYDDNIAMDFYNKRPTGTTTSFGTGQSSNNNNNPTAPNANNSINQSASKSAQLAAAFKKTRRDIDNYDVLKEDEDWDDWHRTFKSMAGIDDCDEVLDHYYSPGQDEQGVFELKQKHIYAVLLKKLRTTKGTELVKQYDGTHDAQKIYQLLVAHYTDSQHAEFVAEGLLQKIVTATMPSPLEKKRVEHLHDFKEWMRRHNHLSAASGIINDANQLKYIKRYAEQDPQMRQAKLVIESQRLLTGISMTPARAMAILEHHAGEADNADKAQILTLRAQKLNTRARRAYMSDMVVDEDDLLTEEQHVTRHWHAFQAARVYHDLPDPDVMESTMDSIEAYRAHGRPSRPSRSMNSPQDEGDRVRINGEAWNQLTRDGRRMFGSICAGDTRIIAEYFSKLKLSDKTTPTGGAQPSNRRAHLTELDDIDETGEGDLMPATRGSNSHVISNDSRMVNAHRVSTTFTSPFDAESTDKDHGVFYEAHNTTMDLEATNPLRFLSVAKKQVDDDKSDASSTPDLVGRDDSTSSDKDNDSFNDGSGFRLVIPKKKRKQRRRKKKKKDTAQQEPLAAAEASRDVNAYEFLINDWDSTSSGGSRQVSMAQRSYRVSSSERRSQASTLMDRGCNGWVGGADLRLISVADPKRVIDVTGLADHQITNLNIGTYGAVCMTNKGPVIVIIHEVAGYGRGRSIACAIQMEDNGVTIDDRPVRLGGTQSVTTLEGYVIPLDVINGLCYMKLRPFTDREWRDLPHVELTRDTEWDPTKFDSNLTDDPRWMQRQPVLPPIQPGFSHDGDYLHRADASEGISRPDTSPPVPSPPSSLDTVKALAPLLVHLNEVRPSHFAHRRTRRRDYANLRRFYLGVPEAVVQASIAATTQFYQNIGEDAARIIDTHRSRYPGNNVHRRNEKLATDLLIPDTPAWGGSKLAQLFVGRSTYHVYVSGMSRESEFPGTLEDVIRKYGAPNTLISDMAKSEISRRVKDLLRKFCIDEWNSEPHFQWQNFAERIIQELKKYVNWVLNTSGAPPEAWFLALEYVVYIWNRTARKRLDWRTPYEVLLGSTPDVSVMLHFEFWEPVLIQNYRQSAGFPSESNEVLVRIVGYSDHVGHSVTFKVWNEETSQLLYRSRVKKISELHLNRRVMPGPMTARPTHPLPPPEPPPVPTEESQGISNENIEEFVRLMREKPGRESEYRAVDVDPVDLIGRTYLKPVEEDGERYRAKIIGYIEEFEGQMRSNPELIKFRTKIGDTEFEEIVEYNDICNFIDEQQELDTGVWKFRQIIDHRVRKRTKEVLIVWESGEQSWEPASNVFKVDKYELAKYCKEAGILDEWSTKGMDLRKLARREKNLLRMVNQAKLRSHRLAPVYMFGYQVPRNHQQAVEIDTENGNTKWQDSETLEIRQMQVEYNSFRDLGHKSIAKPPPDYKRINLHFVYAVKHDGRHKSRLVAGGHLTDTPIESVYAGVVSLRGVRLVIFLAELNGLELWQTDIGNAYLEARTNEKVYVIAGPEFKNFGLEGHILVLVAAVYGLKSSGKRWHDCLADVMRDMGFTPCLAEPDIWMRECKADGEVASGKETSTEGHFYEYVAVYTDDLTIASKKPKAITDALEKVYKFKLKGTAPLNFLLGCDYYRDSNGVLCQHPKKFIEKMEDTYVNLFGEKPRHVTSPLEKGDHPECDTSEFLGEREIKIYQSMIGSAQWIIQLGRFDIAVHVMSLSSFRAAPRRGHLDRAKRLYGYVTKMKEAAIRYRTEMPDVSDLKFVEEDWSQSPYAGSKEDIPQNIPRALGKSVILLTYGDANLCHDLLSGKAVTGLLHFINKTPFDWYSKKQNTVETATYGAESVAGRTAIEQMRANKLTLHYLGVPIEGASILVGDNKTAVDAATLPHSKLHKRHLMLSFHFLKSAIASGAFKYVWADGKDNASDILTKHWGYQQVWPLLRPILFWGGDTLDIIRQSRQVLKSASNKPRRR